MITVTLKNGVSHKSEGPLEVDSEGWVVTPNFCEHLSDIEYICTNAIARSLETELVGFIRIMKEENFT